MVLICTTKLIKENLTRGNYFADDKNLLFEKSYYCSVIYVIEKLLNILFRRLRILNHDFCYNVFSKENESQLNENDLCNMSIVSLIL